MEMITVYIGENCPRCHELLSWLEANIIGYEVLQMDSAALAEMACDGVFTREAPVMRVGKYWYQAKELFGPSGLDITKMRCIFGMGAWV